MQQAALAALEVDPSENIKLMKRRLDFVYSKLKKMSLRCVKPDGAMYAYPELRKGEDLAIVEKLLEKGVAIAPGSGFGDSYNRFVRISACQPEKMLEKGPALIGLLRGATENALIEEHFSPLGDYIAIPVAFSNYYFYFHFASNHIVI